MILSFLVRIPIFMVHLYPHIAYSQDLIETAFMMLFICLSAFDLY